MIPLASAVAHICVATNAHDLPGVIVAGDSSGSEVAGEGRNKGGYKYCEVG